MGSPVQENKINAPQSNESAEQQGGVTLSAPAFSLTAGTGAGGGSGVAQRQVADAEQGGMPSVYLWQGLVNQAQVGFHKQPREATNDATDYIRPDLEVSELLLVLEELPTGWLKVSRTRGTTVEGYVDKKYVNRMPGQIGHSRHKVGRNDADTDTHHDLKSGDETKADIDKINGLFEYQTDATDEQLFADMRLMCTTIFSMGALQTNILAMIDHFQANTGTNYSSTILTNAVGEHASTKRFKKNVQDEFARKMNETKGDASGLGPESLTQMGTPHFNEWTDTAGGLQIAINDVWAYDLNLESYDRAGNNYEALIKINLHDHFGLDRPDVVKVYGNLAGFRAWYVLQHLRGYKPFIVDIPVPMHIHGVVTP